MNGRLVDSDGNPNSTQIFLNNIDYFYTVRFAALKSVVAVVSSSTFCRCPLAGHREATRLTFEVAQAIFTVELIINMYAHLLWEFLTDGWSLFDFFIVTISLVSAFSSSLKGVSIFRQKKRV
jgi:hypothetical protein